MKDDAHAMGMNNWQIGDAVHIIWGKGDRVTGESGGIKRSASNVE